MKRFLKAVSKSPAAVLGVVLIISVFLVAVVGPYVAPYDPAKIDLRHRLSLPSGSHFFGTDQFGRDIFTRIVFGARLSLLVGLCATTVALVLGGITGLLTGYIGGWFDELVMRGLDIIMSFPYIVLAVGLMAISGPSITNVILVIGIIRAPRFARLARASTLSLRERDYVQAAQAIGSSDLRIMLRHILPNSVAPLIVLFTLSIATAINTEAALSFLGLGVPPSVPSWGKLIAEGRNYMITAPWIATFPGLIVSLTVLGYNLLGDALRDIADVKTD